MKFTDLSDKAKERARDKWRAHYQDYDWWDGVYADAVRLGALMGLEVGENVARTVGGKPRQDPDISFSGFHSQGDGAYWSGFIETSKLASATERAKAEAPDDTELHRLAALAEQLHAAVVAIQVANRLTNDETNCDWPDVEVGMRIVVTGNERCPWHTRVDSSVIPDEIEKLANKLVDAFADWIYYQLKAEDEYLSADEQVDAAIFVNDPDFDEDGNPE